MDRRANQIAGLAVGQIQPYGDRRIRRERDRAGKGYPNKRERESGLIEPVTTDNCIKCERR